MSRENTHGNASFKTVLKRVFGAAGVAAAAFVAVLFLIVIVQMVSGKEPNLFGYRFYYILTDSMSPELLPGDVVLSKSFASNEEKRNIKIGDVVTFIGNTGSQNGKKITHRVVSAPYLDEAEGKYFIITKGDKEGAIPDAPIPLERVEAKSVGKAYFVGFLFRAVRTPVGYVLLIVVPVCVIIAILVLKLAAELRAKKAKEREAEEERRIRSLKEEAVKEYLKQKAEEGEPPPEKDGGDPFANEK